MPSFHFLSPKIVTLEAYIDKYTSLVPFLADSPVGTPPSDDPPAEQISKAISLQVGLCGRSGLFSRGADSVLLDRR